jgi:ABC-type lipoprotein export system ATPase subunit
MGPSGSGKTSLLSTLSHRIKYNKDQMLYGNIYINEKLIDKDHF